MKTKKRKASRKTLIDYADAAMSRFVRLSQAVKHSGFVYCVTCMESWENGSNRKPEAMYWKNDGAQCGHYMPKGKGATAVRWLLQNVAVQDDYCNRHKSGNQSEFTRYLDRVYGQEITDDLRRRKFQAVKYTDDEIKEIADLYNEFADELEKRL